MNRSLLLALFFLLFAIPSCRNVESYDFDTPPESSRKIFEGVGYETVWQCCLDTFAVMNIPIRHSEKGWIRSHRTWHEDFFWQLNVLVYPCPDTEAVTVLTNLEIHRPWQLDIDFVWGGGAETQLDLLEEDYGS